MTKDKDFKRIVRARMADEQEPYTAAKDALRKSGAVDAAENTRNVDPQSAARLLGHHRIGEEHVLLALLESGDSLARRVLDRVGLTSPRVLEVLATLIEVAGAPEALTAGGTTSASSYHEVVGRARGFAFGSGRGEPLPEHLLLALCWQAGGVLDELLRELDTDRLALFSALAEEGGATAPSPPTVAPVNPLLGPAQREALRLEHSYVAGVHVILALLSGEPDDVAQQALQSVGLTHEAFTAVVVSHHAKTWPPTRPGQGAVPAGADPQTRQVLACAEGLAASRGEDLAGSADALVALLWESLV